MISVFPMVCNNSKSAALSCRFYYGFIMWHLEKKQGDLGKCDPCMCVLSYCGMVHIWHKSEVQSTVSKICSGSLTVVLAKSIVFSVLVSSYFTAGFLTDNMVLSLNHFSCYLSSLWRTSCQFITSVRI